MDIVGATIDKLEKSYLNAFQMGAHNGNTETFKNPAKKQEFKDHFLKLCRLEQTKNDELDVIRSFKCSSLEEFDREYKTELKNLKNTFNVEEESMRYKKFAAEIDKIVIVDANEYQNTSNVTMEGGDMEVKETQHFIDPISKIPIVDPVRSRFCGHVYERRTITEAIKMNRRMRCAYMGCNNANKFQLSDLVDDPQLKAKLHLMHTQQEKEDDDMD